MERSRSSAARRLCCAGRRLSRAGGFSGISITEDCETALELHATRLEQPLCRQAADRRPAAGNFCLLHRPALPLVHGHDADLPDEEPDAEAGAHLAQRACYLSSAHVLVFPDPADVFLFAPLLFIFFNLKIYIAHCRASSSPIHAPTGGSDPAPELCLRTVPLAVGVRAL